MCVHVLMQDQQEETKHTHTKLWLMFQFQRNPTLKLYQTTCEKCFN